MKNRNLPFQPILVHFIFPIKIEVLRKLEEKWDENQKNGRRRFVYAAMMPLTAPYRHFIYQSIYFYA